MLARVWAGESPRWFERRIDEPARGIGIERTYLDRAGDGQALQSRQAREHRAVVADRLGPVRRDRGAGAGCRRTPRSRRSAPPSRDPTNAGLRCTATIVLRSDSGANARISGSNCSSRDRAGASESACASSCASRSSTGAYGRCANSRQCARTTRSRGTLSERGELREQPRLADAGFTGQEDEPAVTGARAAAALVQQLELVATFDQRTAKNRLR